MDNDQRARDLFDRIDNSNCRVVLDNTHRWIETDGFYEMAVYIITEGHEFYLHTITDTCGSIEDEYSDNNPQLSGYTYEAHGMLDFDTYVFILDDFEHFLNGDYSKIDRGHMTGEHLEYQEFL